MHRMFGGAAECDGHVVVFVEEGSLHGRDWMFVECGGVLHFVAERGKLTAPALADAWAAYREMTHAA